MKRLSIIICAIPLFIACTSSIDKQMNLAEKEFIKEVSYMTEKKALSEGIDYYKSPQITARKHTKSLTGKDLIKKCNDIINENNRELNELKNGNRLVIKTQNVSDIKEYAIDHPVEIIANEFEFSGTFTHYGSTKYAQRSATVIVIPKIERYILHQKY